MSQSEFGILDHAAYAAFAVAIIAFPFLVVNWIKYMKRARSADGPVFVRWAYFPTKSVMFFVIPGFLAVVLVSILTSEVRSQVLAALNRLPDHSRVFINGTPARDTEGVITALRSIAPMAAHHSHPTRMFTIELQTPDGHSLILRLGRDSGVPQEYWVFFPGYRVTARNEIGRINTQVFNDY